MHEMSKTHVEMGESASGVLHKMQSENKQVSRNLTKPHNAHGDTRAGRGRSSAYT